MWNSKCAGPDRYVFCGIDYVKEGRAALWERKCEGMSVILKFFER